MSSPSVVGVVGTAKNTGKTTTLSYLMHQARRLGVPLGITGIGYDGEELDNITSLPKPRLLIPEETIVATSEECLRNTSTKFEILARTDAVTALGEVIILRITQPGLIVLAGPNRMSTLRAVLDQMKNFGMKLLLVDGSLNRIAPMAEANKIVFTTGASRNTDISLLAEEMKVIERVFSYPTSDPLPAQLGHITLLEKEKSTETQLISLLDDADVLSVAAHVNEKTQRLFIPGLFSPAALRTLIVRLGKDCPELVIADPFKLLLAADPLELLSLLEFIDKSHLRLSIVHHPKLVAVTINPFYPKPTGTGFSAAYVDKNEMMEKFQRTLSSPLFNVKENTSDRLFTLCAQS